MSPKELRSRRLALRLTTAALAADLGLPAATVDAWERGEVPIEDAAALARRLAEIESRSDEGAHDADPLRRGEPSAGT